MSDVEVEEPAPKRPQQGAGSLRPGLRRAQRPTGPDSDSPDPV